MPGDIKGAGVHFANCVRIFPQPQELLAALQQKLPAQVIEAIFAELAAAVSTCVYVGMPRPSPSPQGAEE